MSKIIRTFMFYLLPRVLSVALLTLVFSVDGLAKNNCETGTSPINPLASANSGIGGTGATTIQSGIGGTGIQSGGTGGTGNKEEGGIGGTGRQATNDGGIGGTGIIGIITGFASICVNGIEIHYDPDTPVSVDGQSSTTRALAAGQMVVVRAHGTGNELTAHRIAVVHAVVGPIDSINTKTGEMRVLDQTIQIHGQNDLTNLKAGEWVQVSGHRLSNGVVVASRIEPSRPRAQARINGYVTQIDPKGLSIDGTRIALNQETHSSDIALGAEISVGGYWDNKSLQAQHIQIDPIGQFMDQIERVVIESYVPSINREEFSLGSRTFKLEPDLQFSGDPNNDLNLDQLVQISGQLVSDQHVIVNQIDSVLLTSTYIPAIEAAGASFVDESSVSDQDNAHQDGETNDDNIEGEFEQKPDDDADPSDSSVHEHLEQSEDSHSQDDPILSTHEPPETFDELEEFDPSDRIDDDLDLPIDLDTFDESHDHDIHQDLHDDIHHDGDFDWDFDRH